MVIPVKNGNPVLNQVEDKHFQVVMDSHLRENDKKRPFFKDLFFLQKNFPICQGFSLRKPSATKVNTYFPNNCVVVKHFLVSP
jgi:hypothetical protein